MDDNRHQRGYLKALSIFAAFVCTLTGCQERAADNYDPYASKGQPVARPGQFRWPQGKTVALSLTFDDARLTQADKGLDLLDSHGVKATFYVQPPGVRSRLDRWKKAVTDGHEIGNHTLNHPCSGNYTWSRDKALEDHTIKTITAEIDDATAQIEGLLGVTPTTFAYPCGQTYVGRGVQTRSYVPLVAERFILGRGAGGGAPSDPLYCDLAQATGTGIDRARFESVKNLIEEARKEGRWVILYAHEMCVTEGQGVSAETLNAICEYARDPANGVWIDTVDTIARYVIARRQKLASE